MYIKVAIYDPVCIKVHRLTGIYVRVWYEVSEIEDFSDAHVGCRIP